jgi:hypothetical protein
LTSTVSAFEGVAELVTAKVRLRPLTPHTSGPGEGGDTPDTGAPVALKLSIIVPPPVLMLFPPVNVYRATIGVIVVPPPPIVPPDVLIEIWEVVGPAIVPELVPTEKVLNPRSVWPQPPAGFSPLAADKVARVVPGAVPQDVRAAQPFPAEHRVSAKTNTALLEIFKLVIIFPHRPRTGLAWHRRIRQRMDCSVFRTGKSKSYLLHLQNITFIFNKIPLFCSQFRTEQNIFAHG